MSRTHDTCTYCGDSTIGHCMVNSCMYADARKNEANYKKRIDELEKKLKKAVWCIHIVSKCDSTKSCGTCTGVAIETLKELGEI